MAKFICNVCNTPCILEDGTNLATAAACPHNAGAANWKLDEHSINPGIQGDTYKCNVCDNPCYTTPLADDLDGSQQAAPSCCVMFPSDELPQADWQRIDLGQAIDEIMISTRYARKS